MVDVPPLLVFHLVVLGAALVVALRLLVKRQPVQRRALDGLPGVYGAHRWGKPLTDLHMAALRAVPALANAFIGYDRGGIDWPPDVRSGGAIMLRLTPDAWDGMVEWFISDTRPDVTWVFVYARPQDLDWTTDEHGEHGGTHPSGGIWLVSREAWELALMGTEKTD